MSDKRDGSTPQASELLSLATEIVTAYLEKNSVPSDHLPELIQTVHRALAGLGAPSSMMPPQTPAVPVKKSVMPDYIVCLEDGKKLKMLKRHLRTVYGMTPQEYRQKWGLPPDYPMVAPNYTAQRAAFAKSIGLGRTPKGGTRRRGRK